METVKSTVPSVVPAPHDVRLTGRSIVLPATVSLTMAEASDAADTLTRFAARTHGVYFSVQPVSGSVGFVRDAAMPSEAYRLALGDRVTITAADGAGWQNGVSTLIQLMERRSDAAHLAVPEGEISDEPGCSWRGLMVDLARDFHEFPVLLEYVDLCRFYKIRTLHLHFTDDQSYTLPSRAFPRLSTAGRCYTEEQINRLVAYAARREVLLMPEIDVPGHCLSFAKEYGEIFGTDGIICQSDLSMGCMETLFRELCGMFPNSPYIHIGGDEAAISKWTECEKTLASCKAHGINPDAYLSRDGGREELAQILYANFISRTARAVLSCGRTPVVWEGFSAAVNSLIPSETVVMSWENYYQVTPSLLKAGFRILNCSWSPMYVVAPDVHWTVEQIYNWNVYRWQPVHGGSPYIKTGLAIEPTEQVEGGQLLAWGDRIMTAFGNNLKEGVRAEQKLLEERVPVLSENTWNREKVSDYAEFLSRYTRAAELYERFRKAN